MYLTYSRGMGPGHRHPRGRPGPRGARTRRQAADGTWEVSARIERFIEPVLLLLLSERPMHGYELLEHVPGLAREERRVDLGNLYRLLRSLEEEGIVTSTWDEALPGPAKRVYGLTDAGRDLLARWAAALGDARELLGAYIHRYEEGRG
jgi:PadR family transcriptional regulator, regulatory protein PadR